MLLRPSFRARKPRHRRKRPALFSALAAVVALLLLGTTVIGSTANAPAAYAADGFLEVTKTVDDTELGAGDEFTYTIKMSCADEHCIDATLTDQLPPEFEGFGIVGTPAVTPPSLDTSALFGCAGTVTADCEFVVNVLTELDGEADGEVGLRAGADVTLTYTLKVPANLTPSWTANGDPLTNTAEAAADNAVTKTATATVTVTVPVDVDVAVTKAWAPGSQQFQPGIASTLTLGISNTSNVNAESLALQDPKVAADAEAELHESNPFRIVDFVEFDAGGVTAPQGADQVQVDAYVLDGGTWSWQTGPATAISSIGLPPGVDADDVAGLRVTFTDDGGQPVLAAGGAPGSVALVVAQRSTDRQSTQSLVLGEEATNVVTGTVVVPGEDDVSRDATAPYEIGGLDVVVSAEKTISPSDIPAGGSADAVISGMNNSNGPLSELTISDNDGFFTDDVIFGGFTASPTWPAGADTAHVVWYLNDVAQAPAAFASGATPVTPGGNITGFDLVFEGEIDLSARASAEFAINTTSDLVASSTDPVAELENTITVTGENPAGTSTDDASAPLAAHYPAIDLSLDKSVTPSGPVTVGGSVVVQLEATTSASSQHVRPDSIEVVDMAGTEADDFWKAFNLIAIAPTPVPFGSVLTIYTTTDGVTWNELATVDGATEAKLFEMSIPSPETVTGLRFVFDSVDQFGQGTIVQPSMVFEARSTLRGTTDPVSTTDDLLNPEEYENVAASTATGEIDSRIVTSPTVEDTGTAGVVTVPAGGGLYVDKQWRNLNGTNKATIVAQSADHAVTRLSWGVPRAGFESVTVTDTNANEDNPEHTTFQAFNLTRILPMTEAAGKFTWDRVSQVQLYHDGVWNTVPVPSGSWMNGDRGFRGYTLTADEMADTTGVRITVVPDQGARDADADNPTRPVDGSGIASGEAGANRHFDLQWSLRNTLRVPDTNGSWATGDTMFNTPDQGYVLNGVEVAATHSDPAQDAAGVASDDIRLVNAPPGVNLTHTTSRSSVVIPNPGDIELDDYPTVDLTLTAHSTSAARASYLRVTTPVCGTEMPDCESAADGWEDDPFTGADYSAGNPFERVNLTGLSFTVPSGQVSKDDSMVTFWVRDAAGDLQTTAPISITAAEAMDAASLADVVGVSVVYQAVNPEADGGSIVNGSNLVMTMHTQVRETLRSGGSTSFVVPTTVNNAGTAQSYDPVLASTATPHATAPGSFSIMAGALDATAAKQFTPNVVIERNRGDAVQVRLSATDGASTAPTHRVTLTDVDAEFWDAVTLTGLGAVTLPNGADRVRVDVQAGDSTWVLGTAAATAALPGVDPADVTGIRFVFDRADGELFSTSTLPADWSASAVLNVTVRDTYRDSGDNVDFPDAIDNTLQVESARTEDPAIYVSATAAADDTLTLDTGTFGIDVVKSIDENTHTIDPGEEALWTLSFRNTGTGYLNVDSLVDTLPGQLTFMGEEPTYSTTGSLSTDVELDTTTAGELHFSWPAGGDRMDPGEVFTITLSTILQPSTQPDATNQFVVTVDQTLGTCTNASGNGQGLLPGLSANECGTSNYVEPRAGASVVAYKGVQGDVASTMVDGAINTSNPARECVPDADGYFVSPCAANTVVGGTDEWSLRAVNSGTELVETLTFVEPLPVAGDRMLATGSARGSTWRPVFDESFGIDASEVPAGTSVSWEVSTDADLCVGTGTPTWTSDPTCTGNSWTGAGAYTGDWANVTGVRVLLDFAGTAQAALEPGESATVLFRTVNEPATSADASLAPVTVPANDQFAWNQFGVTATFASSGPMHRAPIKAGVRLPTAELDVAKVVTGGAAALAPAEFLVDVTCTIAGVPMDLGPLSRLALNDSGNLEARVDGIPLGADCTVSEVGSVGEFGETARTGDDVTVSFPLATAQSVTITNDYGWGQLTLEKTADQAFAAIGNEVTYTITVANDGERTAEDRTVTDLLPDGATLVSTSPVATLLGDELSWEIDELAPGDSVTYAVVVEFAESGSFLNRATVDNPPGPWQPVRYDSECSDDPLASCATVVISALTVTGIVWLDWALVFAGILLVFGLLVFWGTRRLELR